VRAARHCRVRAATAALIDRVYQYRLGSRRGNFNLRLSTIGFWDKRHLAFFEFDRRGSLGWSSILKHGLLYNCQSLKCRRRIDVADGEVESYLGAWVREQKAHMAAHAFSNFPCWSNRVSRRRHGPMLGRQFTPRGRVRLQARRAALSWTIARITYPTVYASVPSSGVLKVDWGKERGIRVTEDEKYTLPRGGQDPKWVLGGVVSPRVMVFGVPCVRNACVLGRGCWQPSIPAETHNRLSAVMSVKKSC
jgi:hypothetical protein